jgi:hypothetical protein
MGFGYVEANVIHILNICDRPEIQPCEDILCCADISENGAKCGYLMVSSGFLSILKPAITPRYTV